jgi:RNA recognition motif-containing protein
MFCIELKVTLYHLFSGVGEVIEIIIRENQGSNKLRGQAFIVFREQEMADKALTDLRGFSLFGKPMVINSLD